MSDPSAKATVRLNKFIADSGHCSRRKADALIAEGRVRVNGEIAREMGLQVMPGRDEVSVDGQPLGASEKYYLAFHKPVGYITTRSDERSRRTIYDLIPEECRSVDPAGRLDRASSGLLILSNDGDFLNRVTHPRYHHEKHYEVTLTRALDERAIKKLLKGVMLEPEHKLAKMAAIEPVSLKADGPPVYRMTLITGYNRQIRRSLDLVGAPVTALRRVAFGPVKLGGLKPGAIRSLTPGEMKALLAGK